MGLKYSVNEFISLIADGTLHHSDIIDYAGEVDDVKELLYSLWLSNIACVESTGKPLVTTCSGERRIDYAISIISKKFNVNVLDDDIKDPQIKQIDNIVIYQDSEQAKKIIQRTMKGKRGKEACIAIRALIKAKIITQTDTDKAVIYRAIEELIGEKIGSASGINKYWSDSTLDGQINTLSKKIEQQ
ncbi:MAG: hypothetical protein SNH73_01470 [Rikenellaceae bacterium]